MEIYSNSEWTVQGLKAWKCRRLRALNFSVWLLFDCISKWRKISQQLKLTGTMLRLKQWYSQGTTEELRFFSLLLSLWALKHSTKRRLHWVRSWRDEAKTRISKMIDQSRRIPVNDERNAARADRFSWCHRDQSLLQSWSHVTCQRCSRVRVTPGRIPHPELLLQLCAACWVGLEDAIDVTVQLGGGHLRLSPQNVFHKSIVDKNILLL